MAKKNQFTFNNFADEVFKDLDKGKKKNLSKAASVVQREIKKNIRSLGLVKEGNLLKGIKNDKYDNAVFIGATAPAFHAFIVEFGHAVVLPAGYSTKNPNALKVVPGTPFMLPAFRSTTSTVIDIMSEEW